MCCTSPIPPALLELLGMRVDDIDDTRVQYSNDVLLFPGEIKKLVEKGYADAIQLYGFDENLLIFRLFSPLAILDFTIFSPDDFPFGAKKGEKWVCSSCIFQRIGNYKRNHEVCGSAERSCAVFQNLKTSSCVIHANQVRPEYCGIYPISTEYCPPHRITGKYSPEKLEEIKQWESRKNAGEYLIHIDTKNINPSSLTTKTMTKLLSKVTGINQNKIDRLRAHAYKNDPIAQHIAMRFIEERNLMNKIKKGAKINCWI